MDTRGHCDFLWYPKQKMVVQHTLPHDRKAPARSIRNQRWVWGGRLYIGFSSIRDLMILVYSERKKKT